MKNPIFFALCFAYANTLFGGERETFLTTDQMHMRVTSSIGKWLNNNKQPIPPQPFVTKKILDGYRAATIPKRTVEQYAPLTATAVKAHDEVKNSLESWISSGLSSSWTGEE